MTKLVILSLACGVFAFGCGDDTGTGGSGNGSQGGSSEGGSSEGGSSGDGGSAQGGSSPNEKCVANCQRDQSECDAPVIDCQVTCDSVAISGDNCPTEWGAYESCRADAADFCASDSEAGECSTEKAAFDGC